MRERKNTHKKKIVHKIMSFFCASILMVGLMTAFPSFTEEASAAVSMDSQPIYSSTENGPGTYSVIALSNNGALRAGRTNGGIVFPDDNIWNPLGYIDGRNQITLPPGDYYSTETDYEFAPMDLQIPAGKEVVKAYMGYHMESMNGLTQYCYYGNEPMNLPTSSLTVLRGTSVIDTLDNMVTKTIATPFTAPFDPLDAYNTGFNDAVMQYEDVTDLVKAQGSGDYHLQTGDLGLWSQEFMFVVLKDTGPIDTNNLTQVQINDFFFSNTDNLSHPSTVDLPLATGYAAKPNGEYKVYSSSGSMDYGYSDPTENDISKGSYQLLDANNSVLSSGTLLNAANSNNPDRFFTKQGVTEASINLGTNITQAKTLRFSTDIYGAPHWAADGEGTETVAFIASVVPLDPTATLQLEATKILDGRTLAANEFTFQVLEGSTVVATGTNGADGKITFTPITYTEIGTHTYTIKEVTGSDEDITYDTTEYSISVDVTVGDDNLEATITNMPSGGIVFNNDFIPDEPITVPEIDKTVTDGDASNDIEKDTYALLTARNEGIMYTVDVTIPTNTAGYTSLVIKDTLVPELELSGTASIVSEDGTTLNGVWNNDGNTVSYSFDAGFDYSTIAGQTITMTIPAKIRDTITDEQILEKYGSLKIPNQATFNLNNQGEVNSDTVYVSPPTSTAQKPPKPLQTSDNSNIERYIQITAVSFIGILLLTSMQRKRNTQ